MRSGTTRVKVFFLVLSLILFKLNSFSQTKTEFIVEPINPIWQDLKSDFSQVNKLNNHINEYRTNHKPYNFNKNIFDENDLTVKLDKPTYFESKDWVKINAPEGGSVKKFYRYYDSLYLVCEREVYGFRENRWVPFNLEGKWTNAINCLYLDTLGTMLVGTQYGLMRTTDKGKNWVYQGGNIGGISISDITKFKENEIFLSTINGIFKGQSDQQNFTSLNDNLTNVLTLTFETEQKIWAGTGHGVYKSNFPQINWESVNLDTAYYPKILINKNGTVYTFTGYNVCKSTDNGNSWQYLTGQYFSDISLDGDSDLIITGNKFIFRANENGIYWHSTEADKFLLTTFNESENEFYVGTLGSGAYKYDISNNLFSEYNSGLQSTTIRAIEILKNKSIFAATDAGKFYISYDGSLSWNAIRDGWTRCTKQDKQGSLYVAEGSGLIRSTDYGETWTTLNVNEEPFFIYAMDISEDGNTICVGYSAGDVYVSNDRGNTFNKILHRNYNIVEAVIILKNNNIMFQRDTLFTTTNNGAIINTILFDSTSAQAFIQDYDGYIYMAGYPGIYRSIDGKDWKYLSSNNAGTPKTFKLDSLNNVYVIFYSGSVIKTQNKGESWTEVAKEIETASIWGFDLDSDGNIYNGTQDMGLFYNKIVVEIDLKDIIDYKLENNYPNPFNATTRIRFEVPNSSDIKLSVYDILGRKIETLIDENKQPGLYVVEWNASNYASGIYFAVMNATNHNLVTKMVLLR